MGSSKICGGSYCDIRARPPVPDDQSGRICPNEQTNDVVGNLNVGSSEFTGRRCCEFILGGMRMSHVIADPSEVYAQASYETN